MRLSRFYKDKVVIVTGASSGIGLASARLFGSLGAKVVMAARRLDVLEREAAQITAASGAQVLCVKADVSIEDDCRRMVEEAVERFGHIDVLVNNAGISMRAMFMECSMDVLRTLMDVNFWGTVYCTKYAMPYLLETKGSVVGVISIAGYSALPARAGYSASKYAVRGFLDTIRIEHLHDGLNVLAFAPNYVESNVRIAALTADGTPQGKTPLKEEGLMSAERCARYLAWGIAARRKVLTLTFLGRLTAYARMLMPNLDNAITYRYIAREKDSPFK